MVMIKYHNFFLLSPSLLGELWEVQNPSSCDIIIFPQKNLINIFEKKYLDFYYRENNGFHYNIVTFQE